MILDLLLAISDGLIIPNISGITDVGVGDFNEDNHLDLVLSSAPSPRHLGYNRICLGNSEAQFDCKNIDETDKATMSIAVGDIDKDGHLDVLFGNVFPDSEVKPDEFNRDDQMCFGMGDGTFECQEIYSQFETISITIGELADSN